jgi:ATP-dependent helicase/nuclease subunit A
MDGVKCKFTKDALVAVAQKAVERASGARGLRAILEESMLEIMYELPSKTGAKEVVISEETDDVVRIITVHASKGLEFPVVVFANMAGTRIDRTTVVADRPNRRLHVKLGAREQGFRTPGYDDVQAGEERHRLAEERRLLYVAATRAKDRLVLSFIAVKDDDKPPADAKCLNDWLRQAGAHLADRVDLGTLDMPRGEPPVWRGVLDAASRREDVERVRGQRGAWIGDHDALVARGATPLLVRTASALKPEWDAASSYVSDGVRRGRAAEFGTVVHALLERAALHADRIDAGAAAVAREYGMRDREREMISVASRALSSDAVRRALCSRRMLLEAPFTVALPGAGGLAEGRIDLLFEEDGGIVIVDFKTDAVSARDVEERASLYRHQALVYAWAAHAATSLPVREVIFLFARPDPAIEHRTPVDAAFTAEAEALMRGGPVAE